MKTSEIAKRSFKVLGMTGAMLLAVLFMNDGAASFRHAGLDLGGQAQAEEGGSGHANKGANKGGQGAHGANKGGQGAHSQGMSKVLGSEESDSDKPIWAGGNKELNPHSGTPNPSSGTKKGDTYGDLWVVVRDPVTGAPILKDGEYQVCLDTKCTQTVTTVDGELPEGVVPAEVELGRANVARSPSKVFDHALDEVISKLTSATSISTDDAGRLVIDGVTVDSPLENLALYDALMTSDPRLTPVISKLEALPGNLLDLAASALAAGSDKTGTITIDYVVYLNEILGITTNDTYYNFGSFDYNRDTTYSGTISYYVDDGNGNVTQVTEPILKAVFDNESYTSSSGSGITDFMQAAEDALRVIEFTHTTVHTTE